MNPSEAIDTLREKGMTEQEIGQAVGARQSTINRIKRGEMIPNWQVGAALIALATPARESAAPPELADAA